MQRNPHCYSWHEANIPGLQVRNSDKPIKVKSESSPLLQIPIHHQMCNLSLIQKSICTTKCGIAPLLQIDMHQDLNQGPSECKLSVQTTTPPVLETILIEQQAIILPR